MWFAVYEILSGISFASILRVFQKMTRVSSKHAIFFFSAALFWSTITTRRSFNWFTGGNPRLLCIRCLEMGSERPSRGAADGSEAVWHLCERVLSSWHWYTRWVVKAAMYGCIASGFVRSFRITSSSALVQAESYFFLFGPYPFLFLQDTKRRCCRSLRSPARSRSPVMYVPTFVFFSDLLFVFAFAVQLCLRIHLIKHVQTYQYIILTFNPLFLTCRCSLRSVWPTTSCITPTKATLAFPQA